MPGVRLCSGSFLVGFNKRGLHPRTLFGHMKKSLQAHKGACGRIASGRGIGDRERGEMFFLHSLDQSCDVIFVCIV